jgi:hypothetical protein
LDLIRFASDFWAMSQWEIPHWDNPNHAFTGSFYELFGKCWKIFCKMAEQSSDAKAASQQQS